MELIKEQTRLAKWGNSKAARIPSQIIKQLKLDDNQDMTITIENGSIVLTPIKRTQPIFTNYLRIGKMTGKGITSLIGESQKVMNFNGKPR
ncbi:PemI-like protein [Lactiplantibacillus plantarum subsp. plantarum]|nr:AbrB/MazE/SpoVT family DNA-binding domain-containing protein [Lactiplantibacillus plantarum]USR89068.1 AbrB/MazE/SpoVT family DNA-binding domain-containing protein [Lactiplantibacillus pentosus]SPX95049.1 PemI-like protein [Lactiplantibacillus plantarum subsp. plantarum]